MHEGETKTELWKIDNDIYRVTTHRSGAWSFEWLDDASGEWVELVTDRSDDDCFEDVLEVICAGL